MKKEKISDPIGLSFDELGDHIFLEHQYSEEHPTPEQLLVREAVRYLTPKQKKVWELWNYDGLTQDQIANKLKITQQTVQEHIKAIEKRITKWVRSNLGAYELLKKDYNE